MRCPNCSANLKPDSNVCEYCQTEFPKANPQPANSTNPMNQASQFNFQYRTSPQKSKKGLGCIIAVIVFFVVFGGGFSLVSTIVNRVRYITTDDTDRYTDYEYDYNYEYEYDYDNSSNLNEENTTTIPPTPIITLEQYNKLSTGMTYDEVVAIIGSEGELRSESGEGEYNYKMYAWVNHYSLGGNAAMSFRADKLVSKAQAGLK